MYNLIYIILLELVSSKSRGCVALTEMFDLKNHKPLIYTPTSYYTPHENLHDEVKKFLTYFLHEKDPLRSILSTFCLNQEIDFYLIHN